MMRLFQLIAVTLLIASCSNTDQGIVTGAEQINTYIPYLEGKNIGIVANHTSLVGNQHLVDTLVSLSKNHFHISCVFSPEHGFRGLADAGESVKDDVDTSTGLPIVSLYGSNRKPTNDQLKNIDLVVFDIQDIGVRFFTYISTMHYVMEACAGLGIPVVILDRPNPNGNYIDGPVLDTAYRSFVGMHPIPVVHGLTVGELAKMINGEGWLMSDDSIQLQCDLTVIPCKNYTHSMEYILPVKPSPNLPNQHAIRMYPSMCFFEGTAISEGRGTLSPFEIYGHPSLKGDFSFVPRAIAGMAMSPRYKDLTCYGVDLRNYKPSDGWNNLELKWLIDSYKKFPSKEDFFIPYFDLLAGNSSLKKQIQAGLSDEEIRSSWQADLHKYQEKRVKYLLYK